MTFATKLAEKYLNLRYETLTDHAIQKAKECIIDYLGCTYAGCTFESSKIVREFAVENFARGKCSVIGSKEKLVPTGACLVNSTSGHAPELDDTSNKAMLHVGVIVIPVALAMAETLALGGMDIIQSIVVGYDMDIKVSKAANPGSLFARGFHPTSICGMFGATITAARLMGLTIGQAANALGIAGSYVAGNLECYSDGSLTKRLQAGIASSAGVTAASLAKKGYTGPKSILEGPRGFFHAYCQDYRHEELNRFDGFEIENVSFKPHACCRFNQAAIDGILEICSANQISHKDIKSVLVELSRIPYDIVGQPAETKFDPKNVVDGQFSAPYSVAIACIEGKAFLEEYSELSIQRDDVREFMRKIDVKHSPYLDKIPDAFPARVTVIENGGKSFVKEVKYAKGDPENPLSWEEIVTKFNILVPSSLLYNKQQVIDCIKDIEAIKDIRQLTCLLN